MAVAAHPAPRASGRPPRHERREAAVILNCKGAPEILPRQRLLDDMDGALAQGDLLIVAGAGFGKHTLVRQFMARGHELPLLRLDPEAALPDPDRKAIVFADDANQAAVDQLGRTDRAWRLVIVADQLPRRDLSVVQLNGVLAIIDADQLRMDGEDVARLLPETSRVAVAKIVELTGGWPIAVQALARRLVDGKDLADGIEKAFVGLRAPIFDFCETHILDTADEEQRHLLCAIAAMIEIDRPIAELLAGAGKGVAAIETGVRFGLLRRIPDRAACWQSCHPMLARHLQHLERERDSDAIRRQHRVAADHFAATGESEMAIYHARYAENWAQVAELVQHAGGWRLAVDWRNRQSNRDWLHNCVEDLPESFFEHNPGLRLARAMLRFCCGEVRAAMRDYDQLSALQGDIESALGLEITIVGQLMRMLEERPPSIERRRIIRDCLERIPASDVMTIALMENALSIAAAQRGETEDALESAGRARRLYARHGSETPISVVGLLQGRACSDAGMRNLALRYYRASLEAFEQQLGFNSDLARCSRVMLGREAFVANDLATAQSFLADALPWIEAQEPQFHAAAYLTSTRLAVLDGGLEAGAAIIDTCIRFAQRRGLVRLERLAQICWLEQLCGAGEARAAVGLAQQTGLESITANRDDRLLSLAATMVLAEIELGCDEPAVAQARLTAFRASDLWLENVASRVQLQILMSIAALKLGEEEASSQAIADALRDAIPEGLARLFIDRGADVYPILRDRQRAQQRKGRFANHAEDQFVTGILAAIRRERQTHRLAIEGVSLTAKEEEIAELLTKGLSNKEIARLVGATDNTVKWHLKNMFRLFNVASRNELVTSYQINLRKRTDRNVSVAMTSFHLN